MYEILGRKIPITITFRDALTIYPNRGLKILNILDSNNAQETLQTLLLNDEIMLDLWKHYIAENNIDEDEALDALDRDNFQKFKNEVWNAVVNFSDPQMQGALREIKKLLEQELANQLQPKNLRKSFSDTVEE